MHFHLPSYLPYYPEFDSEDEKGLENEIELIEQSTSSRILGTAIILVSTFGLIFMLSLYV